MKKFKSSKSETVRPEEKIGIQSKKIQKGKFILLFFSLCLLPSYILHAQKVAYVDLDYILNAVPEYKNAQDQLDKISLGWQKEIENKLAEVDRLYKSFQSEEILLTQDMKKKREDEIIAKEKEAKELQKQRFGVDGDLYKKRQELVKPVQDKVYNAIKALSEKEMIAIMFNKSAELNILFANPKYDKSEEVLESMGVKVGGAKSGTEKSGGGK
ncbi:MAG: OmpH family outer membrane protein [Bacteroidetes bacterium]|nr:OmpH family outer membrane protein [Bacteroidota bacterium]